MADSNEITKEIVVAMIQNGHIIVPSSTSVDEKTNVAITKVQDAYREINKTVLTCIRNKATEE